MDISNLKRRQHVLLEYLNHEGYGKDAKRLTRRCVRLALVEGASLEVKSYEDLFSIEVKRKGYSQNEQRYKSLRSYMGAVKVFDLYGKLPNGESTNFLQNPSPIERLNTYYRKLAEGHLHNGNHGNKREKTIFVENSALINFFYHLQNNNASCLQDVTPNIIYSFFYSGSEQIRGGDYCSLVKRGLGSIEEDYKSAAQEIISLLPSIKRGKKNFEYLNPEEVQKILKCLEDKTNDLSRGERLIGWLLYFYGLRGSDITSLKPENIDWEKDMISVIQSKTNYPLSLPLIATVGNAILDYVITSRPSTTEPNILVTSNRPHKPYKQSASAVLKIFRLAGVRTSGGIKGFRTFRHHFVTSLLSHNVECDVVSSLVGHQSPTSLKPYADADLKHLKECAIDVSVYDINPNVFKL